MSPGVNGILTGLQVVQPSPSPHELRVNPPSTNEISTDNAEQLVLLEKPENEKLYRLATPRCAIFLTSTKIASVLIFAICYHTFCFIVHYRNVTVPIGGRGVLGLPFLHCE